MGGYLNAWINHQKKTIIKETLKFPNKLFFSLKKNANLNSYYGTKNKKYLAEGLINVFRRYNFTVIESTPV